MTPTLALTIAGWIWVAAGLSLLGCAIFVVNQAFRERYDYPQYLILATLIVGAIGSLVLALRIVGFPSVALWVWRVLGIAYLLTPVTLMTKVEKSGMARAAAALNVLLGLLMAGASFVVSGFEAQVSRTVISSLQPIVIDGIRLWHGVALGILAVGTVIFLILFVRMVERGVSPQIESSWGGIGGGMGGWRLSSSLTYLAAAAVFGVLFAVFVFQLEANGSEKKNTEPNAGPPASPSPAPHKP